MSRAEIFAKAKEIAEIPYDAAKEPDVKIPPYNGAENSPDPWINGSSKTPATTVRRTRELNKVCDSVLDLIGNTPLVKFTRIAKAMGLDHHDINGKMEFFSGGGSIKDRIALRMFEDAENEGRIKPGDTIIEPTSGNTGMGLCVVAAVKGYNVIICMPKKMSGEKINSMETLGALILRTENSAAWNDMSSHIGLAMRLQKQLPNAHVLDQYWNVANPLAHYDTTAEEILEQMDNDIDIVVCGAGTGGTITGISRKVKEKCPKCIIVGVDPYGSILATPDNLNDKSERSDAGRLKGYQVEGIGYDFIPTSLDRRNIDAWVKTDDDEGFACARGLIRHEGLFVGGSCGTALAGMVKYLRQSGLADPSSEKKRIVVVCPDGTRNYMSKFLDPAWMAKIGMSDAKDLNLFPNAPSV